MLKRLNEREETSRDIFEDRWSVSEKIEHLLEQITQRPRLKFSELFDGRRQSRGGDLHVSGPARTDPAQAARLRPTRIVWRNRNLPRARACGKSPNTRRSGNGAGPIKPDPAFRPGNCKSRIVRREPAGASIVNRKSSSSDGTEIHSGSAVVLRAKAAQLERTSRCALPPPSNTPKATRRVGGAQER